jgi:hypothetical protein
MEETDVQVLPFLGLDAYGGFSALEWDKWPSWVRHSEECSRETDGEARRGGPSGKKNKLQKE